MEIKTEDRKPIRSVVLGCGQIGSSWDEVGGLAKGSLPLSHLGALSVSKNFEVVGIYDTDLDRANQASVHWKGLRILKNVEEVSDLSVDLVVIATPPTKRLDLIKSILKKDIKLIFCEKPLSSDPKEAQEIIKLIKNTGIDLVVNFSRTFSDGIINLSQEINDGLYGRFMGGTAVYGKGLLNNGCHVISTLTSLLGKPVSAKLGGKVEDDREQDPTFDFDLTYDAEAVMMIKGLDHRQYTIMEFDLFFSMARIKLVSSGNEIQIFKTTDDSNYIGYRILKQVESRENDLRNCLVSAYGKIEDLLNGSQSENLQKNIQITEIVNEIYSSLNSGVTR